MATACPDCYSSDKANSAAENRTYCDADLLVDSKRLLIVADFECRHDWGKNERSSENTDHDSREKSNGHLSQPIREFPIAEKHPYCPNHHRSNQGALPRKFDAFRWGTVPKEDQLRGSTKDAAGEGTSQ